MSNSIKYSAAGEKKGVAPGLDQQQTQRIALALAAPLIKRILEAILPIKMGPVSDSPGVVDAPHIREPNTSAQSVKTETRKAQPSVGHAPRRATGASKDPMDTLEGKVPFRVRTDLKIEGENVVRFDIHQRVQHILMFTSFLTLAITGIPQKTHAFEPSQWLIAALGGLEMTKNIHHIAGMVMVFDCVYHMTYVVVGALFYKNLAPLQMIPNLKDMRDAIQQFSYFLGLADKPPKFDRFSYLEKFDYFAVFWGMFAIGATGLILMFPVWATKILPGQAIPVALVAHSDEAVLAIGWIFVVHFFYAHFAPHIFPMNTSIFTGRVPKHRYIEEHPLDWERAMAKKEPAPPAQAAKTRVAVRRNAGQIIKIVGTPSGGAKLEFQTVDEEGGDNE